jgi:probable rRNA maturation factor
MKKRPKSKHLVHLQKKIAGLNESALQRFVVRARKAVGLRGTVNVLVTSSAAIRSLNRQFRSQNRQRTCCRFTIIHPPELRKR